VNPFGLATIFPDPAGILFPGMATAAGINAGALGIERATTMQLAYGPPVIEGESHRYFGSFATSKKGIGFGAGINGSAKDGNFTNGAFAGIGFDLETVGMGLAVRVPDLANLSRTPNVDVGMIFGKASGIRAGFVLYNLESAMQLDLGVGYSSGKNYNLEANILLPPFGNLSNGNFGLSLGANLFIGALNFLFRSTYYTATDSLVSTLGAGVWLNQKINLGIQFTSPHIWTAGLTLVL
jgi:hypothetical protein